MAKVPASTGQGVSRRSYQQGRELGTTGFGPPKGASAKTRKGGAPKGGDGVSLTYGGDIVPKIYAKGTAPEPPVGSPKASKPFPARKDRSGSGFVKGKR